jgi:hypothetical protein
MNEEQGKSIAGTLQIVSEQLETVAGKLAAVDARSRKTTFWLTLTIIGFVLDVILTGIITVVLFNQGNQSDSIEHQTALVQQQATLIHSTQLQACAIGNKFRMDQKHLWNFLLFTFVGNAPNPPGFSPEQIAKLKAQRAQEIASFTPALTKSFKMVNCAALYPTIKK